MTTVDRRLHSADAPTQPHPPPRRTATGGGNRRDRREAAHLARIQARRRNLRRVRRVVALALVAMLIPVGWSYYRALTAPGSNTLGVRSVEWLKDNGMNGVVNTIEHWWYSHNQPSVGGKLKHGLPQSKGLAGNAHAKHTTGGAVLPVHLPPPANMQPLVTSPLPGEGVWHPTGRTVAGFPAVYTAYFRPDAVHTGLVAAAMWMDTTLLKTVLIPGTQDPGGPNPYGAQVPVDQRAGLVASFNSGFKISDARGGYYNFGQQIHPLLSGAASLVIDNTGKATVGAWGRDFSLTANVATVRQNLSLLVDNGQLVPGLGSDSTTKWGATLGNNLYVWRSGVGTDASGGLIYVAGPALSVESLAILLQRAGAVRAMELDINTAWVSGFTYQQIGPNPNAVQGVKLLPSLQRPENHDLMPGERDFFALFANR
jgi:Phosphodiester glycosidase